MSFNKKYRKAINADIKLIKLILVNLLTNVNYGHKVMQYLGKLANFIHFHFIHFYFKIGEMVEKIKTGVDRLLLVWKMKKV